MHNFFLFLLLVFISFVANAQPTFIQDTSVIVKVNGQRLKNPWAGGFNCPQYSTIDLNNDGIKDLFVFDRNGNTVKTFINKGTPGKVDYVYAPQYEAAFPAIQNYALLYDYNCDGKEDIFASANGGIMVYRNDGTPGNLKFTLVDPLLHTLYYNQYDLNLYVSSVNIPAIADIDNDGDLDILTFEVGGSYVEYHKNMSKEKYGTCDSLVFEYQKECWGHFTASSSANDVTLNAACTGRHGFFKDRVAHSGSTLLAFDANGDGLQDLLVGDIIANDLLFLTNGGTIADARMVSKIDSIPYSDVRVNMYSFPAAFLLDVDNDGLKDLLIAPNLPGSSENVKSTWFYKNVGSNSHPQYKLMMKDFLQNEMIEVGEGAAPSFFDYDGDGLKDLLIGSYGYFNQGTYKSGITLFKNTGTTTIPVFELVTTDYAAISAMGLNSITPTFGDVDGDGDMDMVVGESLGKIYFFNNTAGAGNPPIFIIPTQPWFNIDVGYNSAPQLVDVDKDGLLDLLIGSRNGNIVFYKNTGTITTPSYTLVSNSFGKVDTRQSGYITGYNSPLLLHCDKQDLLLCGTEEGHLYIYSNVNDNLSGVFTLADPAFEGIRTGYRAFISAADINGDSKPDMVIGNYGGGIALFLQTGNCVDSVKVVNTGIEKYEDPVLIEIHPNPASESIIVNASTIISNIQIMDILGHIQYIAPVLNEKREIIINVTNWPNGMYMCSTLLANGAVKNTRISIIH